MQMTLQYETQKFLGFSIILTEDYEEAKAACGQDCWNPLQFSASYSTQGKALTQLKREIRQNLAGYRVGQVFAIYRGQCGLGTPETPFQTYYACVASR